MEIVEESDLSCYEPVRLGYCYGYPEINSTKRLF